MSDKILSRILLLIQEDREDEEFFKIMDETIFSYEVEGNTFYIVFNNGKRAVIERRLDSFYCKFYSFFDLLGSKLFVPLPYLNEDSFDKPMSKDRVKFYLLKLSDNYIEDEE